MAAVFARLVGAARLAARAARARANICPAAAAARGAKGGSRASLVFDGRDVARSRSHWPRVSAAVAASPANRGAAKRYSQAMLAAEEVAARSASRYRSLFMASSAVTAFAAFFVAGAARSHELA